ncbi:MAG: hydroxymethylbilane synthase [Hyphomonadaceae bacterium]
MTRFRIGARGSQLSLTQTGWLRAKLAAHLGVEASALELIPITTSGDRIQDRLLIEAGGKGLFTKELDDALLEGRIDFAVHSLKDLPTQLPDGVLLACVPEREDPRDAFISNSADSLNVLPPGANVGTASLRRQAQTLYARPDLGIVPLRGNVETRLRKIDDGVADATFLALAGLKRLGLDRHVRSLIDPNEAPPAACQGALAVTARSGDAPVLASLAPLQHTPTRAEIEAERGFLEALDGSCRTPIGALARYEDGWLSFIGETLTPDGTARWRRTDRIQLGDDGFAAARALGLRLGGEIKQEAGDAIIGES